MHEYPITLNIIETAMRHAEAHGGGRVTAVHLVVGDHSGCLADSIELYFDVIAGEGMCAGARLVIERVRPMLRCKACGGLFPRKPFEFACPAPGCGGEGEPTDIGREFFIKAIEIESAETESA